MKLARRTFLRGALGGATLSLALPALEAMLDDRGAYADESTDGPIFGVFFWANGLPWHAAHGAEQGMAGNPDLWTPTSTGAGFAATPLLSPLMGHQVSVVTGLEPHTEIPSTPGGQGDGHMRGFMVALTGDRPRSEGFDHPSHTLTALRPSLDQLVAEHPDFYGNTPPPFRSLVLGVSKARFHDYGHWNAISYNAPDSTNLPADDPGQLYDLLFDVPADAVMLGRRAKLLDAVLDDAKALRVRLGATDRQRLDSHMDHLSEVQRRLELGAPACTPPAAPTTNGGDIVEATRIRAKLLASALACGLTRVFSFMVTSPATNHVFANLGVYDGMHKVCHDGAWEQVRAITEHQMVAFAALLDELQAQKDPTGQSMLDKALVFGTSEYGEGWKHGVKEMPVVLAGRAGGALNTGVHVRQAGGNFSRAQLTALQAIGLNMPSFGFNGGETNQPFPALLAS